MKFNKIFLSLLKCWMASFESFGWPLLRAEGFFIKLDVLYEGIGNL